MHPSELFAPPRRRASRWPAVAIAAIAGAVGAVLLSLFVDALHLSLARGEALRASLDAVPYTASSANDSPPADPARLQLAHR